MLFQVNPSPAVWNSLEVVKLIVSLLTPVVVVIIGLWISKSLKRLEYSHWTNQKITEKRIAIFDQLAPMLNDLLCYFTFVGCWKELKPTEIIERKRRMDQIVHINAPLFSKEFTRRYNDLIEACYGTYSGWGKDPKLRTFSERRKQAAAGNWQSNWDVCFSEETDCSDPRTVKAKYESLMSCFSEELGVGLPSDHFSTGKIPANIK